MDNNEHDNRMKSVCATSAFQDLLKTLCLTEFPCGIGSWRNPDDQFAEGKYSVTSKNYGAQHEKMEVLHEYLSSGTWDVDTSWSNESATLRRLAVSEPWKISKKFIGQYFRTLRLIDKQITEIDPGMKNLDNLEELTLSVNKLDKVPSEMLPSKIKVLELCYNCLKSVSSICKHASLLTHLGLSYNLLADSQEYKYFTGEYWPALLSLDLSYNNLVELVELTEKLSTLPQLQNLVLQGNPLSLIPGYRGHVVDALRNLMVFDDIHVSADEKHHFKGLGKKKELILDEAQMTISIGDLKGIPMPDELKEDTEKAEFPVITTTYHVKYDMLLEEVDMHEDISDHAPEDTLRTTSVSFHPGTEISEKVESVVLSQKTSYKGNYKTRMLEWAEDGIHLDYRKLHVTDELVRLKDYLNKGIKFTIIEEKVLQWPTTPVEDDGNIPVTPDARKGKTSGKETPQKKGKDTKVKDKGGKGGSAKAKEKKKAGKESVAEMRSDPPVVTEIGHYNAPLASFVEGGSEFRKTCHCGGGPMPEVTIDDSATPAVLSKLEGTKSQAKLSRKKSPVSEKRGKSGKASTGKKGDRGDNQLTPLATSDASDEDEKLKTVSPITLSIKIDLLRWRTAADSLKQ